MSIKLEKVVQTFYEGLEEGKLLGRKCPKCGNVEFPPVYACNACGNYETEWYEISGKARLHQQKEQEGTFRKASPELPCGNLPEGRRI